MLKEMNESSVVWPIALLSHGIAGTPENFKDKLLLFDWFWDKSKGSFKLLNSECYRAIMSSSSRYGVSSFFEELVPLASSWPSQRVVLFFAQCIMEKMLNL